MLHNYRVDVRNVVVQYTIDMSSFQNRFYSLQQTRAQSDFVLGRVREFNHDVTHVQHRYREQGLTSDRSPTLDFNHLHRIVHYLVVDHERSGVLIRLPHHILTRAPSLVRVQHRDHVPGRDFNRAVVYGDEREPVVVLVHIADHARVHLGVLVQLCGAILHIVMVEHAGGDSPGGRLLFEGRGHVSLSRRVVTIVRYSHWLDQLIIEYRRDVVNRRRWKVRRRRKGDSGGRLVAISIIDEKTDPSSFHVLRPTP